MLLPASPPPYQGAECTQPSPSWTLTTLVRLTRAAPSCSSLIFQGVAAAVQQALVANGSLYPGVQVNVIGSHAIILQLLYPEVIGMDGCPCVPVRVPNATQTAAALVELADTVYANTSSPQYVAALAGANVYAGSTSPVTAISFTPFVFAPALGC
jgi:hypothetical protein